MATINYSSGTSKTCVIEVCEDLNAERAGFFRAFWWEMGSSSHSPVVGYCSAGGSHRTISACVREVRRLGHTDPIYRNGRLIDGAPVTWRCVNPRAFSAPTPLLVDFGHSDGRPRWCVVGTDYGFLHTTGGDVRTWGSASGARRAAANYRGL